MTLMRFWLEARQQPCRSLNLAAEREGLTRASGPRPPGDACASSKIACGDFVEPHCLYLGFESRFVAARRADGQRQALSARMAEREGFEPSKGF